MSYGARLAIGTVAFFCAVAFAALAPILGPISPRGAWPVYLLSSFCAVIGLACFRSASRPVTLRLIGAIIFVVYAAYVWSSRNDLNVFRAIVGFIVFGLPGAYTGITGRYPIWGKFAQAFPNSDDEAPEEIED